jgi:hypothetical protein
MKLFLKKSDTGRKPSDEDAEKLSYFKKKILEYLDKKPAPGKPNLISKALACLLLNKAGKPAEVGTIREWKGGKKYIKTASGKWKRKYESESRGIKQSLAAIRRSVNKAQTTHELMQIVLDNRDRFSDAYGHPLPIVQELSAYIDKRGEYLANDRVKKEALRETERAKKRDAFLLRRKGAEKTEAVLESDVKNSPVPEITKQYMSYKSVIGNNDDININGEEIPGRWKLVEADAPSASHNEVTFAKTKGFPETAEGATVNDRDYEHDKAAQEMVFNIARNYDSRALSMDNPVVVTQDGVVISGNNRTMSSKVAARNESDMGYIETLKRKAGKFGIKAEDIDYFKNPRIVFEVSHTGEYTVDDFAKFNARDTKQMSPVETAVKISKRMQPETLQSIADEVVMFDTIGELYANAKASAKIFSILEGQGLVSKFDMPQYYADNHITEAGKEFFETAMLGSVMKEANIRNLSKEGGKQVRQTLVRAIIPLIENKDLEGYSIINEFNDAVSMVIEAHTSDKFKTLDDLLSQRVLISDERSFEDEVTVAIAKKIEGTQKEFADFMGEINCGLKISASGQADIFAGGAETKKDILKRLMHIKKSVRNVLSFLRKAQGALVKQPVEVLRDGKQVTEMRWTMRKSADTIPVQFDAALDFDGVINSYKSGWHGAEQTDEPVPGAAEAIRKLMDTGRTIAVYSTRANTPSGEQTIREYLRNMIGETSERIHITDRKPIAAVYVDDRAIPFTGDWKETLEKIETFKPWIEKSLTYSGYPLQGRTKVQGMDISIENKRGSTRSGTDKDGHTWSTPIHYDYGYIRGTVGTDKDHLDCYIGDNPESEIVYIVNQNDPVTGTFDEQKVMLGFTGEAEAKAAYLQQYDRPGFFGDILKMDIDTFKEKAFDAKNKGKPLKR